MCASPPTPQAYLGSLPHPPLWACSREEWACSLVSLEATHPATRPGCSRVRSCRVVTSIGSSPRDWRWRACRQRMRAITSAWPATCLALCLHPPGSTLSTVSWSHQPAAVRPPVGHALCLLMCRALASTRGSG